MKNAPPLALACVIFALLGCGSQPAPKPATPPATPAAPAAIEPATCGSIKQLHLVGDIYLASQPSSADYALLKDRGVKTVINLRHDNEIPTMDEGGVVEQLGMAYVDLPWNGPDELTDATLDAMRDSLLLAERPLMLKCGSSNRVGAGWLAYRVLDEGVPIEQALAEAKQVGMRTPAYETKTLEYIRTQQDQPSP